MSIRVLIADDQDLVRGALKVLLNLEPDIKVVAELGSGVGVADAVKKYRVDVALLDIVPSLSSPPSTAPDTSNAQSTQVSAATLSKTPRPMSLPPPSAAYITDFASSTTT